jgi:hypothetical protein
VTSPEESILEALSQLLEGAKAIERTIEPFVTEGLEFTPRRSDLVESLFHDFDRAKVGCHEALRAADQFSPRQLDE